MMTNKQIKFPGRAALAIALLSTGAVTAQSLLRLPVEDIQVRKIKVDPTTGLVTLRWDSQVGSTYAIEESVNPEFGWQLSNRNISSDSLETISSFLPQQSGSGARTMFFRIRKVDGSAADEMDLQAIVRKENALISEPTEGGSRNPYADGKSQARDHSSRSFTTRQTSSIPLQGLVVR